MYSMRSIIVYHKDRKIILWERTPELEDQVDRLEVDEPFIHRCNDRMSNILNTFFENEGIKEISFEHADFEKLVHDFKSYFKYIEAAGGLVKNSDNELLVIHRLGFPDLPKGKIDRGEKPEETAIREVSEECGISDLKILTEANPSYHIYLLNNKKILKKTFWYNMTYTGNEKLIPQREEAITEVEWCKKNKLLIYKDATYESLKMHFNIE